MQFTYRMPTKIVFGPGVLGQLGEICESLGDKPLIVTGRQSARKSGVLEQALAQLPMAVVYEGVEEDPGTEQCDEAAAFGRKAGCGIVVPIGGGSPMDAAKAIAGLMLNDGPCADYVGRDTFTKGALPIVAVPTTAGTGSEVTPYSVLVNERDGQKQTIGGENLFPRAALLDPLLTHTMPRSVTVNTGLDALSQAMEGVVSKKSTPKSDVLALEACRIIRRWLPAAAEDGNNAGARSQMLYAAMLSGCVIAQTATTLVHGMGYLFTTEYGVAHGMANALLLTPLFQHNAQYAPEKVAAVAEALGHPCGATPDATRKAIGEAIHELLGVLSVPPAAAAAGVEASRLAEFADGIAATPYRYRNQIGHIDAARIRELYEQAHQGALA